MQRNYYEVLGVARTATKQEIKEKYYTLARQYHPDRAKDKQLADRLFVQINRAYTTLKDDVKRGKYDAGLEAMNYSSPAASQQRSVPVRQPSPSPSAAAPKPPPVAPAPPQQVREWYDQASRLQMQGDLAQAIQWCGKAIEADPNHFGGILLMGDLLAQSGKPAEAQAMFDRALKIQPTNRLLREKIARLAAVNARRATNPGLANPNRPAPAVRQNPAPAAKPNPAPAARPVPTNIAPPYNPPPKTEPVPAEPKSIFDRLLHRK